MIKECYKAGFYWREVAFAVEPTTTAPPGFQLSSFHGPRPLYGSDPTPTIPTGIVSNNDPTAPTYLPGWEPRDVTWETPTGASPFGLGPVPALQPVPPFVYRPEITSGSKTQVSTDINVAGPSRAGVGSRPSQGGARPPVAGPSRILQARAPSTFVPRGVPGSARVNINLVRHFTLFDVNNTNLSL